MAEVARRRRILPWIAALAVAALVLRVVLWRPLAVGGALLADGRVHVAGAVHVHTTLSDGGGTPEEVIAAARHAGLAFVAITDHNNLDAKPFEGYHEGLLVIVGTEVSTTVGHVVGLGIPDPLYRFSGDGLDALDDLHSLGGVAFAAHPTSARADFRWTGWELPGHWGLELLNGDSQWRAAGFGRLASSLALYGLNQRYALLRSLTPPDETLDRWDALLGQRDVPGIVGADAHSRLPIHGESGIRFPSYESLLGLVQNHVLLDASLSGDAARDARSIVEALGGGRSYVGVDALAPAGDFAFFAEAPGQRWVPGETAAPLPGLRLRCGGRMPAGTRLRLLRNGTSLAEAATSLDVVAPGPGVYRVEARVPRFALPWILTNPIYVFGPDEAAARAARSAWPAPTPVPAAALPIEALEQGGFVPEHDPASSIDAPTVDPTGGSSGGKAARLSFHLGQPSPGHPFVWCALADRTSMDLSGRKGLVFGIRGDGVYRIFAQVRDKNAASQDDGMEVWFASVRTSTEWQRVALPFARFRSLNKRSDGKLDLDQVRQIVFVIDVGAEKPGSSGRIWIEGLGAY